MQVEAIRRFCLSIPHATEKLQWGDALCFKVAGKLFTVMNLDAVPQNICFKCSPETFQELLELEDIRPAPYLGRHKWIMLDRLDALPSEELRELIAESYAMVAAKLKTAKRPRPSPTRKPKTRCAPAFDPSRHEK